MNRNLYKHLYAVLPLALVFLLAGCTNGGEDLCPDPDEGTASYMMFRIVAPKAMVTKAVSRAVPDTDDAVYWGADYLSETGTAFDNVLLRDEFNVFITGDGGTPITKLRNLICIETAVGTDKVVFSFSGEIPQDEVEPLKTNDNAKIHIAANCGSDISLADDLSFSHAGQPSATFTAIPMWGVKSFNFTTLQPGQNDAGEIWLLRAMAKVEIVIGTPSGDEPNFITALTSASVASANTQGYVLPQAWRTMSDTKTLSFDNSLRALSSAAEISGMAPADDKATDKIVFYLPETANTDGTAAITLNYATSLNGNESRSGVIKFGKYENGAATGTPYDIVRNHLYRFEVFLNGKSEPLTIKYTVCPWQEHKVNPPVFD